MQNPSSKDRVHENGPKRFGQGLDIELRKKFQRMEFKYFYELEAKVTKYRELLKEDSYRRKKSMGTYC